MIQGLHLKLLRNILDIVIISLFFLIVSTTLILPRGMHLSLCIANNGQMNLIIDGCIGSVHPHKHTTNACIDDLSCCGSHTIIKKISQQSESPQSKFQSTYSFLSNGDDNFQNSSNTFSWGHSKNRCRHVLLCCGSFAKLVRSTGASHPLDKQFEQTDLSSYNGDHLFSLNYDTKHCINPHPQFKYGKLSSPNLICIRSIVLQV